MHFGASGGGAVALTRISGPENWQDGTIRAKKHNGVVTIRLWGTTPGTYTIPAEYRPEITQLVSFTYNGNSGQASVSSVGNLTVTLTAGTVAYASITYVA